MDTAPVAEVRSPAVGSGNESSDAKVLLEVVAEMQREQARVVSIMADAVAALDESLDTATLGAPLGLAYAIDGQCTRGQLQSLRHLSKVKNSMPRLAAAFETGAVTWEQLRRVVSPAARLDDWQLDVLDRRLDDDREPAFPETADDWVDRCRYLIDEIRREHSASSHETVAEEDSFIALTPKLWGGGTIHGELGPVAFATLAEAFDHITHVDKAELGPSWDATASGRNHDTISRARARTLADWAQSALDGTASDGFAADGGQADGGVAPAPASLHLTMTLDELTDTTGNTSSTILHSLTGGRMHCLTRDAHNAINERGATIRTTLVHNSKTVGVGRQTRVAPGWLADTLKALHPTCTFPGCRTSSRTADLDHANEWSAGGHTDADNLAPLCRKHHSLKTRGHATCTQDADGTRHWILNGHYAATRRPPPTAGTPKRPPPEPPPNTREPAVDYHHDGTPLPF